ncbi:Protein of unknown function [Pyronema omphalodes CBS 100304]|uniref:Uncharacterized protein n=1 Tax=Pyronema omphalodes (strain CBS 100304) TaxID=1076935 RepID=U4LEL1_PYROM|nr:Protein of unknown function [Pyronema omphalodes CBS 100304]
MVSNLGLHVLRNMGMFVWKELEVVWCNGKQMRRIIISRFRHGHTAVGRTMPRTTASKSNCSIPEPASLAIPELGFSLERK